MRLHAHTAILPHLLALDPPYFHYHPDIWDLEGGREQSFSMRSVSPTLKTMVKLESLVGSASARLSGSGRASE